MDENEKLSELLHRNPSVFLEDHQSMIKRVVWKFTASGFLKDSEKDDVVQYINERMLTGILQKMREQYKPSYNLKTYLYKILINLCQQYVNHEDKRNILRTNVDLSHVNVPSDDTIFSNIILCEVYEYLHTILRLYGKHRYRLELLLKITLKIGISDDDILRCYPHSDTETLKRFLTGFEHPELYCSSSLTTIYQTLIPLLNDLEGKKNTADSIRKWVDAKLDEIVEILNVSPIDTALSRETVKILIEKYYREFPKVH
jgi:DNA-directed RNA polymerase specialized sigma24 family protein